MGALWFDVRLALRTFTTAPGLATAVVLTLALSIGATTTIFSLVYAILLRPFPYDSPERLVRVRTETARLTGSVRDASVLDVDDWRAQNASFEELATYWSFVNTLSGDGAAQSVLMTFTTPELFSVLGVRPVLGRVFTPAENRIGGPVNQVVLSYGLWRTRFGGRPGVLGTSIRLRGDLFTVIGVMPPGFRFPDRTDVWVPLMSRYASYRTPWWRDRSVRIHSVLGRLRAGVDVARAEGDLNRVAARLAADFPSTNKDVAIRLVSLREAETGALRPYLVLLLAAVGLVLTIGCVNVASLLLARALARSSELAVRTALGATRLALIRQTLTESTLLAVAGGALGVLLAYGGIGALTASIPVELPFWMRIDVDRRVLGFSIAVSLLTGIACGLAPALSASRRDLLAVFKDGSRGTAGASRQRLRRAFVVAEVAFAAMLFAGAMLMMRSFVHLRGSDPGFDTTGLLSAYVGHFLPNRTYEEMIQTHAPDFRRILDELRRLPGVVSTAGATAIPYYERPEQRALNSIAVRGQSDAEKRANLAVVGADITPGYLQTMGIPVLEGRDLTEADDWRSPMVALVSADLAAALWPGRSALGQMFRLGDETTDNPWHRVVGVVGNTRWSAAERGRGGEVYFSYRQWPTPKLHVLVRTQGDPRVLVPDLRRIVQQVNPENAITYVSTLDGLRSDALWQRRLWAWVLSLFAALALVLVCVGLYGVISQGVAQRLREIGIRMALGAAPGGVRRLIVGEGLVMCTIGLVIGLGAALALGRFLSGLLFEVAPYDPTTYLVAFAAMAIVGVAACWLPAARAARVDPNSALRDNWRR
jgi:putative ABC transport system permease protein